MILRIAVSIFLPLVVIAHSLAFGLLTLPDALLGWPIRLLGALGLAKTNDTFFANWEVLSAVFSLFVESAVIFILITLLFRKKST